jgi:hypothetical protein
MAHTRLVQIGNIRARSPLILEIDKFRGRTSGASYAKNQPATGFSCQQQRFFQQQRAKTTVAIFTGNTGTSRKMVFRINLDIDHRRSDHPIAIADHQTVDVTMMSKFLFELMMKLGQQTCDFSGRAARRIEYGSSII